MPGRKKWVRRRHQFVHDLFYYPLKLLCSFLYGFRGENYPVRRGGGPCLVLSNHTSPLDCICVGLSFDFPLYYVASDHIFRLGLASKLLKFLVAPIPIVKSRLDLQVIKDMLKIIGEGGSVCIFPEGNRNFTGETGWINPSIAKLAKQLKVPLLLYHIEGGYLTTPRWADSIRRGAMTGRVSRVVTVPEMKSMSADELYELIRKELYENDYTRQQKDPAVHRCAAPAEFLERALYLCPACNSMAKLASRKDRLSCTCGLEVRVGRLGFFEASKGPLPFRTVLEWSAWQRERLASWLEGRLKETVDGAPILYDDGQRFFTSAMAHKSTPLGSGRLALYRDRFSLVMEGCSMDVPLSAVNKLVVTAKQTLQFTGEDGVYYEVRSPYPRSPLKYLHVFEILKNMNWEGTNEFFQ